MSEDLTMQDTEASLTEAFVAWSSALPADLPADVAHAARRLVLDSLGVALASTAQEFGRRFEHHPVPRPPDGSLGATVLGREGAVAADEAAMINAVLMHGIDFDETYQPGFVHVAAIVVPTVLAVAEDVGASDEAIIRALVVGYELTSRLGEAAPAGFHKYGWHATPLCGAFGAAAAAASLLGLTPERTVAALGIVGSFASGIQEFLKDGTDTKRLHTGWAARAGIQAARLAEIGFGGPARILEGDFGLFATHLRDGDPRDLSRVTADLGERWNILSASIKPFPCCLQMHAHVEAAKRIAEQGVDPAQVKKIRADIHQTGIHILTEPDDIKRHPRTPYGAQFSLMFGVAVGLTSAGSPIDLRSFSDASLEDSERRRLAELVEVRLDPKATTPGYRGGAVEVTLADGSVVAERVPHNLGSPTRPIDDPGLVDKFVGNCLTADIPDGLARDAATALLSSDATVLQVSTLNKLLSGGAGLR